MLFENSDQFTQAASTWLNTFVNDVSSDPEKVVAKVADFPEEPKELIRKAIREGPECLGTEDTKLAKLMFNFIEFYATGKYSKVDVEKKI